MLKYFLCLKYLQKCKIVFLSIVAVAISCGLLIVVGSLFTGFINAIENTADDFLGDVVLTPKAKFVSYDKLIAKLNENENVQAATAVLSVQGLLHQGKGKVRAVNIWGIDPATRQHVTKLKDQLLVQADSNEPLSFASDPDSRTINGFVSIGLLAEPDETTDKYDMAQIKAAYVNTKAVIMTGSISASSGNSMTNFKQRKIPFAISNIVFTGISQLDSRYVYLPIEKLSDKLYRDKYSGMPVANIVHIKLADTGVSSKVVLEQIWNIWRSFAVTELGWSNFAISSTEIETSQTMQAEYVKEIRNQMMLLLVIFGIVSSAVVLLIFCIFYMIVLTRTKDIAVIKSFGCSNSTITAMFTCYGLLVGIIGSALGVAIGYYITKDINDIERWIKEVFGLKLWDSSVYLFTKVPNVVDWNTVAWVVPCAILAAVIGAIVPAISASRTEPVKVLQYE